jgi:hypothetical protein
MPATLGTIYPNPYNPVTNIALNILENTEINRQALNLIEQLLTQMPSGIHQVQFVADNLASGVYLVEVKTESSIDQKKVLLMK